MSERIKVSQWIVNIVVALLLSAYVFIFNSVYTRLNAVEARVDEINMPLLQIQTELNAVEAKVDEINMPLLQIQTDISSIKTDLVWLKQNSK